MANQPICIWKGRIWKTIYIYIYANQVYILYPGMCVTMTGPIWALAPSNPMEQSPSWKANGHSANQTPRLLRNLKFRCRLHNSTTLVPILSHMKPVHTFPPHFPQIHSDITLSSIPRFSKWSLPFRFRFICISHLSRTCCMSRLSHLSWLGHRNIIQWRAQVMKFSICSLLQPPVTSSILGPNILLKYPQSVFFP